MALGGIELYRQLTILLVLATLSHFTIKRFHQPTIIGEIAIGIVLGPSIVGAFGLVLFDQSIIDVFAALGAIFLLFLIGLESDFRSIYTKKNLFVAIAGVLLPLTFGFLTAYFLVPPSEVLVADGQFLMAMFVGATLVATSTAIAASILLEMGLMRDRVAQTIMGAAVVDDILGLLVLSVVVGMSQPGGLDALSIVTLAGTAIAFIVIAIYVGVYFFSRIVVRLQVAGMKMGLKHGGFIIAMAIAFLYAFISEIIGLSAIIGAFLAGTMFAATPLREDFTEGAGYLGAVFTPVFFISLGLLVNVWAVGAAPELLVFAIVLTAVAIVTKVVGCAVPARLAGMTPHESSAVGWGMTPRGEVGLIVALAALQAGVIANGLFAVVVLVMLLVSVIPAPFLKAALARVAADKDAAGGSAAGTAPETG